MIRKKRILIKSRRFPCLESVWRSDHVLSIGSTSSPFPGQSTCQPSFPATTVPFFFLEIRICAGACAKSGSIWHRLDSRSEDTVLPWRNGWVTVTVTLSTQFISDSPPSLDSLSHFDRPGLVPANHQYVAIEKYWRYVHWQGHWLVPMLSKVIFL